MWTQIPRIELSELNDRGRTELAQVMIPFEHSSPEEAARFAEAVHAHG